jgi:hypothetical protein
LAADLKTLESYSSRIQGVFQSFQVPLQYDYDPDEVAAYFHRRPHVLVFRLLEVHACIYKVLRAISNISVLTLRIIYNMGVSSVLYSVQGSPG